MAEPTPTRGKLKIFFGAFHGAGKTQAMLVAAHRVRDGGRDVVIGVLDLHGTEDVQSAAAGLEILPSPAPGEFDLDRALARRPQVMLIDDLAHTNPAGTRHPKRWNDVDELLAAGIDVFTTMSVQHLESLNDVVAEITGVPERETVPDTFFDTADETVMVDMSADELLARVNAGTVPLDHVPKGPSGEFFRKGSLLALREIALRRTADVVEDEVRRYRAAKSIDAVWKTQGRLLCCVGPYPGAEHVVRSAARLASQLDEDWTAVYVETPALQRRSVEERGRILKVIGLAEELGARTAILTGENVPSTVVDFARDQNISTVIVGRGPERRWRLRGMSDAIAARSADIDVIEIGRAGVESGTPVVAPATRTEAANPRASEKRLRYAATVALCAAATAAMGVLHTHVDLANVVMVYMLVVLLAAVRWGRGPAIFAAMLNVAAFDFVFVAPRFTFAVHDPQYFVTFGIMLFVGVAIGQLAGNIRFQARVASHREKRSRTLYEFARDLAQLGTTAEVIETTETFMSRHFQARVAVLVPDVTGALVSPTARGMTNPFDSTAAQWCYDQAKQAGAGTDTLAANEYIFLPLKAPTRIRGVLAVRPERPRDLMIPEQRHQFEIFAALVATALERVHYVDVARDALFMARIQSGDVELKPEARAVRPLIDAALGAMGTLFTKHPVNVDIPAALPPVAVDPELIQRVFRSLLGNVAKHTAAGTRVDIGARVAGSRVEVTFEDNGGGLPPGSENDVFESFSRGEVQGTRKGAGLGLAISRAIVEAHGGEIRAERAEDHGARFVVALPAAA
jgi:two-component system sensor histidine kinase KdpD